jgi:hypothetical protein
MRVTDEPITAAAGMAQFPVNALIRARSATATHDGP